MDFVLRLADEKDVDTVGRITVEAYCADGFITPDDGYVRELADAAGRLQNAEVWVAEGAAEILGSVTFCSAGTPYAELATNNEGEFRMLGVTGTARRQGVAQALVVRCIDRSQELGQSALVMSSMRTMSTAHRIYDRLGFRRLPERDWSPEAGIELLAFIRPAD